MNKKDLIAFRDRVKELWEEGKIKSPVHLPGGNEDKLIEIFKEIKRSDYVFCTHRNMYHALLHGLPSNILLSEILKKTDSPSNGRQGSMCITSVEHNFYSSPIIGGNCGIAVGVAWALRESESDRHVWCFVGDSSPDGGHFWSALKYAVGWDLPITFVLEDNDRATCTPYAVRNGDSLFGILPTDKLVMYNYEPTTPHVGSGKYVAF